jgi:hypothetical protein
MIRDLYESIAQCISFSDLIYLCSFVERLFCNALENPQSKSTLVHSLSVCISLLDPKRSTFAAAGAAWGNHISEPVIAPNPETVDGMLHGLGNHYNKLSLKNRY